MVKKKISMLGTHGVGKTSLVRNFVHSVFDEKYHTTIGVKVDEKVLQFDDQEVKLMLWDVAGAEEYFSIPMSYVRGSAGYLLVVDGTRKETLERALEIVQQVEAEFGRIPFVAVLNKEDLTDSWCLDDTILKKLSPFNCSIIKSSAKTGKGVEEAFVELARQIL